MHTALGCPTEHFRWFLSGKLPVFYRNCTKFSEHERSTFIFNGLPRKAPKIMLYTLKLISLYPVPKFLQTRSIHSKKFRSAAALVTEISQFEVWCCLFFFAITGALTFIFFFSFSFHIVSAIEWCSNST